MVEIAAAMSLANFAYAGIKRAMEMGKEAQDVAQFFGRWFDAQEQIAEAGQYVKQSLLWWIKYSKAKVSAGTGITGYKC